MADTMDQEFVEFIVKGLVSKPDEVKVVRSIDEKGVLLELTVDPEDLGRVIGKRGNTAQSIRTLLRALGTKNDARYNLKIVDNGEPKPPREDKPRREDTSPAPVADDTSASSDDGKTSDGASSWAHLSSSNDEDQSTDDEAEEEQKEPASSSVVEKTKKELADLDDLDI